MAGLAVSGEKPIDELLSIMATLRNPDGGCPWDLQQDFSSIAPYTIEEAYEVADAIARNDLHDLKDELGDLLLQVVFHAQMASEQGAFGFEDVARAISDKMLRRHPHVFGEAQVDGAENVVANWNEIKKAERAAKGDTDDSALAGVSRGMPEWLRAQKLQSRAAKTGFDWTDPNPVLDKLHEEIEEVRAEFAAGDTAKLEDEIGDLLFVAIRLAHHARVDAGAALRHANAKFERRFRTMEAIAAEHGSRLQDKSLAEQEALWVQAKRCLRDA